MVSVVEDLSEPEEEEAMAVKLVGGSTYMCPALKLSKEKEPAKGEGRERYSFDITKADQIFDHLLKDGQINLSK